MKTLVGVVTSTKMTQSASVEVTHTWMHPKYKKTIKKAKKFIAHNAIGAKEGDTVEMQETKPMSKLKQHVITKIIEKTN